MNRFFLLLCVFFQFLGSIYADVIVRYLNCSPELGLTDIIKTLEDSIIKEDFSELYDHLSETITIVAPSYTPTRFPRDQVLSKKRLFEAILEWQKYDIEMYHLFGVLYDNQFTQHYFNTFSYSKIDRYYIDVFLWNSGNYTIYISRNITDLTTISFTINKGKIDAIRSNYLFHGSELKPIGYGYYPNVYIASNSAKVMLSPNDENAHYILHRNYFLGNYRNLSSKDSYFIIDLPGGEKGFVNKFDTALVSTSIEPQAWPDDLETEAFIFTTLKEMKIFNEPSHHSKIIGVVHAGKKFYRLQTHRDNNSGLDWIEVGNWFWASESEKILTGWIERKEIQFLLE